jgi:ABC-type transport system involved in multi-copper enzyme maturation permease subunit
MISRISLIASNTVREVIRQRLFANILVFGLGMVVFAMVISNITFGEPDRVVRSIGLSGLSIALSLMALLIGVSLIHREIDQKTVFVVLTRPIRRWEYVVGRYLGFVVALTGVMVGFSLAFFGMLVYVAGSPSSLDVLAIGMSLVQACVLGAFALVLSSFSTPNLSAGIGLGFWIACASTDDLVNLTADASPGVKNLARAIEAALPAFARFNYREAAIYGDAVDAARVAWIVGYGLLYVVGFIALASAILRRREMI